MLVMLSLSVGWHLLGSIKAKILMETLLWIDLAKCCSCPILKLAVASLYNDMPNEDFGLVRIYTWNGSSWVQKGQTLYGEARFDGFGSSISMPNSNLIAIGAAYNDGNSANGMDNRGHVRVYQWDGALWQQIGLDIDGEAAGDNSAKSVSMPSDDVLAIGATIIMDLLVTCGCTN